MRSWISASGPAASVVMIVQLSSGGLSFGRSSFGPPRRPQPRHEQRLAVAAVHVERRLRRLLARSVAVGPPLVPAVHRHQAALVLRGVAERGRGGHLLGAGVDQQRALGVRTAVVGGLRPRRHQAPAHQPHPPRRLVVGFGVPFDDRADRRGRRDVVIGPGRVLRCAAALAVLSSIAWIFSASSAGSVVTANRPHIYPMVAREPATRQDGGREHLAGTVDADPRARHRDGAGLEVADQPGARARRAGHPAWDVDRQRRAAQPRHRPDDRRAADARRRRRRRGHRADDQRRHRSAAAARASTAAWRARCCGSSRRWRR